MGKKNKKKTTWRKLSLHDDSPSDSSDVKDRSSTRSDDSCICNNNRNARLHSMSAKKPFLSSRKYRQYSPTFNHTTDISSGLFGQTTDDCSNNFYTCAEENAAYVDDPQQQQMYLQPFVYPCFITPTFVLPPYHPSQWYEDPRLPYDPQNFICLTQPLTSSHQNTSSINSCSSPETGSEVGYSSSSPPASTRTTTAASDSADAPPREEEAPTLNYPEEDVYNYSHQPPYAHQVAGAMLPEDQQQPPTTPPYLYPGTTYVLKPLAVVRRPPHQECWWDGGDYGGGRRRRRRGFIGGEGITYDRWPSRINKDSQKTQERKDAAIMQEDVDDRLTTGTTSVDNHMESFLYNSEHIESATLVNNLEYGSQVDEEAVANVCTNVDCEDLETKEVESSAAEDEVEQSVEVARDEVNLTPSSADTSQNTQVTVQSVSPVDTWPSVCQDPLRYSKYYQICGVDDELVEDEEVESAAKVLEEENEQECVSQLELMSCADEIVVHEVEDGSGNPSECGSEDVEMLGHRYESGADKIYKANTVPLAVELLGSNAQPPYDQNLKPLMERSKRVTLTSTTGYLSNTRHVMESYCSHLAVRRQTNKLPVVCDAKRQSLSDELDGEDVDVADAAEEQIIFRRSSTEPNVFQPQTVKGRRAGFSPFLYLRNKGPWHGCCCSIM